MSTKKVIGLSLLLVILLLAPLSTCACGATAEDEVEIQKAIKSIKQSVNDGNAKNILGLLSPNASAELKNEIENNIAGKSITFQQSIVSYEDISPDKVKVKGKFAAKGISWSVSGLSNYFIFEKVNGKWLLLETNFHQKLSPGFVFKTVGKILIVIFLIFSPLGIFWLWMLIDCIKRPIENKVVWILVIVLVGLLGAILYFFIERKKCKKVTASS